MAILTRLEFMNRFTNAELAEILTASDANPALRVYVKKLDAAQNVDTNDPETIAGAQTLEAVGLISTGRAAEVLDVPATADPNASPPPPSAHALAFDHEEAVSVVFACTTCGNQIGFAKEGLGEPYATFINGAWTPPNNPDQWLSPCAGGAI